MTRRFDPWEDNSLGTKRDYLEPPDEPVAAREYGDDSTRPEPEETPRHRSTSMNERIWKDDRRGLHEYLAHLMSDPAAGPKTTVEDHLPPGMRIEPVHVARDRWRLIVRIDANTLRTFEGGFDELYRYAWWMMGKEVPAGEPQKD